MTKRIMIVDDEILVRIGIKAIVDWEKYGYEVVAEASNGEEALPLIQKYEPDIVLTDLVMSPIDGFELIKICKTLYPKVKFLVLSSYNDMDNVKRAMKYGALDYVFKLKINPQNIIETLDEISVELATNDNISSYHEERLILKNKPEIKQRLLHTIIEKSYIHKEEALSMRVNFENPYIVLCIGIDDFTLDLINDTIHEATLLTFSIINIIEEVFQKYFVFDVYKYNEGYFIVTILLENSYSESMQKIKQVFYQLSQYIKRYVGVVVSGALSNEYSNVESVKTAVKEAKSGLKMRLIKGGNYLGIPPISQVKKKVIKMPYEGLVYDIEKVFDKKGDKLYDYITQFFEVISSLGNANEVDVRKYCMELYNGLSKNAERYHIDMSKLYDNHGSNLYQVVLNADTLTRISESFHAVANELQVYLKKEKRQLPGNNIQLAMTYICNNLAEELSVTAVSEMLHMNGSYFSHLFKKETGKNFIDYVNEVRIRKAKELLITTDYRIYEIAKMVGIESANYFSILFKKITGKSPNDIRLNENNKR